MRLKVTNFCNMCVTKILRNIYIYMPNIFLIEIMMKSIKLNRKGNESEKKKCKSLSRVQLFEIPWTVQSMGFSRPEYLSGQPFPSPGDLPNPGIEPRSLTLQTDSLPAEPQNFLSAHTLGFTLCSFKKSWFHIHENRGLDFVQNIPPQKG